MQIDTAGTYTLKYTAEDACGNATEVEREVNAVVISYRTVLYTDGTFIINEKSTDIDANVAEHGAATNVYRPFGNGQYDDPYVFQFDSSRPWHTERNSVIAVKIGSPIKPTNMNLWFVGFTNCTSFDFTNIDTSLVTSMVSTFASCSAVTNLDLSIFNTRTVASMSSLFSNCSRIKTVDVSSFDTSAVTDMHNMFYNCAALRSLNVSNFNTANVTDMRQMFYQCGVLQSLDLSSFDTSAVTDMRQMFRSCTQLYSLDLSSFDTSAVTNMGYMFGYCSMLQTIYASTNFSVTQVTDSSGMFEGMSNRLIGGAGTTWSSSKPKGKTYARIDNPPDAPGYFTLKSA